MTNFEYKLGNNASSPIPLTGVFVLVTGRENRMDMSRRIVLAAMEALGLVAFSVNGRKGWDALGLRRSV